MAYLPPKENEVPVRTKAQLELDVRMLTAERDSIKFEKEKAEKDLKEFKEQVRNEVREAKEAHDLCDDGVAEFLDDLGLPPLTNVYRVPITITLTATLQVNVPDPEMDVTEELRTGMVDLIDTEEVDRFITEVFGDVEGFNEPVSENDLSVTIVDGAYVLAGQEHYYQARGGPLGGSPLNQAPRQRWNLTFGKVVRLEDA